MKPIPAMLIVVLFSVVVGCAGYDDPNFRANFPAGNSAEDIPPTDIPDLEQSPGHPPRPVVTYAGIVPMVMHGTVGD